MRPALALAGTSTSQFRVNLTVQAECKIISATDIAFGATGVIPENIDATGTISVQCTNTTPYQIGLNVGAGPGGSDNGRTMVSAEGNTVTYNLYRDAGHSQVWGQSQYYNTVSATGTGGVQQHTVYGRVPPQDTPVAGDYSDIVQVIVTY